MSVLHNLTVSWTLISVSQFGKIKCKCTLNNDMDLQTKHHNFIINIINAWDSMYLTLPTPMTQINRTDYPDRIIRFLWRAQSWSYMCEQAEGATGR